MPSFSDQEKVGVISEALPYLRKFSGKTFVVKYGGASMTDDTLKQAVINDLALLHYVGVKIVLVHGGGPEINNILSRLNIPSKFHNGIRITDENTIEVVDMVLNGKVQKELVSMINRAGAKAIGICGKDANLFEAKQLQKDGQNWGYAGEITKVNPEVIYNLLDKEYLPVISSLAPHENQHKSYNINADNAAYKIAIALKAEKLIYLTNTSGVLRDANDPDSLIQKLNPEQSKELIKTGVISGGMIPKIENALLTLSEGVKSVHILNGTYKHALLLETFTEDGIGTMLSQDI